MTQPVKTRLEGLVKKGGNLLPLKPLLGSPDLVLAQTMVGRCTRLGTPIVKAGRTYKGVARYQIEWI